MIYLSQTIATEAHAGQFRRDGVTPYIEHPSAVAGYLASAPPPIVAAAWLHDVLEDTAESAESLLARGVPKEVVDTVLVLTKRKGEAYEDYLKRVRQNSAATQVKLADMLHNLSDSPSDKQIEKYGRAVKYLTGQTTRA